MLGYYAFFLKDDHVTSRVEIVAGDDDEAVRKARQYLDGQDIEVWQEARKVAVLKHKD
ncbi:hypothetical protein JQ636_37930 [Bradyrhizobium japonicum]|uniref:hypothetical protein n=1 Tax=Bradyrhizobium japonicum TaxID=375 RepID=UPI001BA97FA3|nr:hypothetical protein [Bradyrhizobium japonicum]MBR0809343.1 hypothetical protein [Bradyrhizobium japonicum]